MITPNITNPRYREFLFDWEMFCRTLIAQETFWAWVAGNGAERKMTEDNFRKHVGEERYAWYFEPELTPH